MKKITFILAAALGLAACNKETTTTTKSVSLESKSDSVSYAIGHLFAKSTKDNMDRMGIEMDSINDEVLVEAFAAVFKEDSVLIKTEDAEKIAQAYVEKIQAKKQAEMQAKMEAYKTTVEEFTKGEEGEKKMTASGLQYAVIKEGTGVKPTAQSKVMVHYHGTLPNGEVFDSSAERGQPASFGLNQVIPGWTEGLQLMSVGSKYKLYIPSNLAYGPRGSGPKIGPNQDIEFIVELLEIVE